jgi:rhamnosyl/mannosyltransferase
MVGQHRAHFQRRAVKFASTDLSMSAVCRFRDLAASADVVHYHYPWPMMDLAHFLVLHGKPSVVTYHSDIVRQRMLYRFYKPIMHKFLSSADAIVATSPSYVRTSPVLRRYRDKVRVIPIGIDEAPLRDPDPVLLERWRAKVGSGFFLFIGVARYYKRLDVLLEGRARNGRTGRDRGCRQRRCAAHQSRGRASQRHHLTGAISDTDKAALLHLCGAVVLPSSLRSEAFRIVLPRCDARQAADLLQLGQGDLRQHRWTNRVRGSAGSIGACAAPCSACNNLDLARRLGYNARRRYLSCLRAIAWRKICRDLRGGSSVPMHLTPAGIPRHALMRGALSGLQWGGHLPRLQTPTPAPKANP